MEIHVVRAGETLYTIAQSYSVDETILREANGVPPGGALAVGQTLVIQHPQTRVRTSSALPGSTTSPSASSTGTTIFSTACRASGRARFWSSPGPTPRRGRLTPTATPIPSSPAGSCRPPCPT